MTENHNIIPARHIHEECGVFGVYRRDADLDVVRTTYYGLYALQHRGQESCGIALNVDGVLSGYRDLGLVSEVFTKRVLEELPRGAKMATGHVRYATAGQRSRSNAQPMVLHHCKGAMAVCHNGNLVNAPKLRRKLEVLRGNRLVHLLFKLFSLVGFCLFLADGLGSRGYLSAVAYLAVNAL